MEDKLREEERTENDCHEDDNALCPNNLNQIILNVKKTIVKIKFKVCPYLCNEISVNEVTHFYFITKKKKVSSIRFSFLC